MLEQKLNEASEYIKSKSPNSIKTAIVLGSGLGKITNEVQDAVEIPYTEIPHFYQTTVKGHSGKLVAGNLGEASVYFLSGRIHLYEGHNIEDVVFPVRLMKHLGVENILLTNASGGINRNFAPGELCLIKDQINLTGTNPLIGKNYDFLGERFPDMSDLYSKKLQELIISSAQELNFNIHQGVYTGVLGPSYETPSEVRMIEKLGGDLVGMSTVFEAIASHHSGINVAGISCITNMAAGILEEKLRHDDIKEKADQAFDTFSKLIKAFIAKL